MLQLPEIFYFLPPADIESSHSGFLKFKLQLHSNIQVKVKSKQSIMARKLHDHWLLGLSTSVLSYEFTTSYRYNHGDDVEDVAPFSGRLMLPTKLQVLKLHLFYRDEAGKKNKHVWRSLPKS